MPPLQGRALHFYKTQNFRDIFCLISCFRYKGNKNTQENILSNNPIAIDKLIKLRIFLYNLFVLTVYGVSIYSTSILLNTNIYRTILDSYPALTYVYCLMSVIDFYFDKLSMGDYFFLLELYIIISIKIKINSHAVNNLDRIYIL